MSPIRPDLVELATALDALVTNEVTPSYALALRRDGELTQRFGGRLDGSAQVPDPATVYDVASLTKILATWGVVGRLIHDGHLALNAPLSRFFPGIGAGVGRHTVADLLTHRTTLPTATWLARYGDDIKHGVLTAATEDRSAVPAQYLNRGYLILGWLVEVIAGRPLSEVTADEWWRPLGMHDTQFTPLTGGIDPDRIAPTEVLADGNRLRGVVHDENARLLGGVAGHAGVFSTLADLALFLTALTDAPETLGLSQDYLAQSRSPLVPWTETRQRAIGWWVTPDQSLVRHDGFTGTTICYSPATGDFGILLTNAVYYSRRNPAVNQVRDQLSRAVAG
ncbi:serine hydrolase domain-containing protein [Kribbella sp. NPDC056345]|uniref:serine hydrolase domain-containing protein n=1 Tax=Kribbella sp. NPDC056345 TaxID=3345789 RepID=UPI0035DE9F40